MDNVDNLNTTNTANVIKDELPPLWEHQKTALKTARDRYALFFDPGCGKTRAALLLLEKSGYGNAIIFAPLNVCRNWVVEANKYLAIKRECFVVAGQTKPKKLQTIKDFKAAYRTRPSLLIMNIESLRSKDYLKELSGLSINFIIVDESHNFKSHNSLQTKGLLYLDGVLKPRYFYLLTGTPAPQGEIDLWSTFYLLGITKLPFFVWRKKYFDDRNLRRAGTSGYYPDYVIRESSRKEFAALLKSCSITAVKDLVMDLPPLLRTSVYCELSKEQKKHYDTMEDFLFASDSSGHELTAANVLSRTLRLQQIIAGTLGSDEEGRAVFIKDNPRLKALEYAIEQTNGEQFIIWTIFKDTYAQVSRLLEGLGISYGLLTGEQSAEDRFSTMEDFQGGKIRAVIAHPRAGGVGVNLTAASYSIHYTKNFNLVDDLQCEARNYRGGSERHKRITRIDIIAEDTIDEEINEALILKKNVQDFILGLKQMRSKNNKRKK